MTTKLYFHWQSVIALIAVTAVVLAPLTTRAHVVAGRSSSSSYGQAGNLGAGMDPCSDEDSKKSWPANIIPYTISPTLPDGLRLSLQQAICTVELAATCISLVPRTSQQDYVLFEHGKSCCSHQGVAGIGMQRVYVHESCGKDGLVDTLARLTGEGYTVNKQNGELTFDNPQQMCQDICGQVFEMTGARYGVLESPGFPDNYPNNQDCLWKFWLAAGSEFVLEFLTFDLEGDVSCSFDYVELTEQNDDGLVTRYEKLCGKKLPFAFNSVAKAVSVKLHTDFDVQESGFNATYNSTNSNLTSGIMVPSEECSQNRPSGCTNGSYQSGAGQSSGSPCPMGYQQAAESDSCIDVDECATNNGGCDQRCKNTEGSFYCHCKVGYGLGPGLHSCDVCGELLNASSGDIYSPAFPTPYPPHQNCKWQLQRQEGTYLRVTLTNMDIKYSHKCTEDYLKPSDGHFKNSRRLCNYYSQIKYLVKTEADFSLRFHTNEVPDGGGATGFHLHYDQVPASEVSKSELNFVWINGVQINYHKKNWLA